MMINKRLIGLVPSARIHIALNVICQAVSLAANIAMVFAFAHLLDALMKGSAASELVVCTLCIAAAAAVIRALMSYFSQRESYLSSVEVKSTIRDRIYSKLLELGPSYTEKTATASVVQLSSEGAEQLETYFGSYLSQFFYSMLSPVILFAIISTISLKSAIILFVCVPLIPLSIIAVQKFAKRLLSKYWGQYEALGDNFLENLEGLTTLKIYSADEARHKEINESAEHFRRITMKVLTMQLNSIIVMDIIAYGGAALGIIMAAYEYISGDVSFMGAFVILLLSADFFLPLRMLGSFFHVAMNGMAAADRIFALLDLPADKDKSGSITNSYSISVKDLSFAYNENHNVLDSVSLEAGEGSFIAIAGASGCGKSTIAGILTGRNEGYKGSITIGGTELSCIDRKSLFEHITIVSHDSYVFKGSVKDNLLMAKPSAKDDELWKVLDEVKLSAFVREQGGLEMALSEAGANLSGGQKQRLALARALLKDSDIYIFDEATSNIDVESEDDIIALIHSFKGRKSIIMISHRLANITSADCIYVLENGHIAGKGTHESLMDQGGLYKRMFTEQQALENLEEAAV